LKYEITPLEREKWQNHEVIFRDFADICYYVQIENKSDGISIEIISTPLEERRKIEYPMKLFCSSHKDIKMWGVIENEELIAGIETGIESWAKNPRLYVSTLWVNESHRRRGIASALIDVAKNRAKKENLRAVYLETWSCNEHAVAFYLSQGFKLIGFDICPFSNEDIKKFHVPLKLGCEVE
jgi:ribosomal protein S18 acetylase RimI-like enzyme